MNKEEKKEKILLVGDETGNVYGEHRPTQKRPRRTPHTYYIEFFRNIIDARVDVSFVMKAIIGEMDKGTNIIILDAGLKEKICNYYHFNDSTIRANLTRMLERNIAIRKASSVYFINPFFYTKTNLNKLKELRAEYAEILSSRALNEE